MNNLDIKKIKEQLKTNIIGSKIYYYSVVDSTNTTAKRFSDNKNEHGSVIIAESQRKGRGRQNKSWDSPAFVGVWMSIILQNPEICIMDVSKITSVVGLAVQKAIKKVLDMDVFIKWPNDIIVNNKKVCGILVESLIKGQTLKSIIIGIGVNVNQDKEHFINLEHATSLKIEKGQNISREEVITNILYFLEEEYNKFIKEKKVDINELRKTSILFNKKVRVLDKAKEITAEVIDFLEDGSILIKDENNRIINIKSCNVSIRGLNSYLD